MSRLLAVLPIGAVVLLSACAAPQPRGDCVVLPREVAYPYQPDTGGRTLYCNRAGVPQRLIDRANTGTY